MEMLDEKAQHSTLYSIYYVVGYCIVLTRSIL